MAQADRASSWRLIDAETRTLRESISWLKSMPHSLGLCSKILLLDTLRSAEFPGPRSHMWLLQSAAKYADYRPSDHADVWKTRLAEWSRKARSEPDDAIPRTSPLARCLLRKERDR